MLQKQLVVKSPEEMESFGEKLGSTLRGSECIELKSDLGGGKTTVTRGLVKGIGSSDNVSSPTFTVKKQYKGKNLTCYHFDFYRLDDPGLVAEELKESLQDSNGVTVIEWADNVQGVFTDDRLIIEIERVADNPESRKCLVSYPESRSYLVEDL